MTAAEIQFIIAEAFSELVINQVPVLLIKGIELNFDMLMNTYSTNVPAPNLLPITIRDNFVNNVAVVPAAANLTLTHIMMQKYIALYIHGTFETWVDMRRYHYTDLDPNTRLSRFTEALHLHLVQTCTQTTEVN